MVRTIYCESLVGKLLLAEREEKLIGVWIQGQKYFPSFAGEEVREEDAPVLRQTKKWLERYFAGERPDISELPLAPGGSQFQRAVWAHLCQIPYGTVTTYGALAKELAGTSAQAVGGAVGHNPISIVIPCHRVVGADGSLTGYAGGLDNKLKLLTHEGVDTERLFIPRSSTAPQRRRGGPGRFR